MRVILNIKNLFTHTQMQTPTLRTWIHGPHSTVQQSRGQGRMTVSDSSQTLGQMSIIETGCFKISINSVLDLLMIYDENTIEELLQPRSGKYLFSPDQSYNYLSQLTFLDRLQVEVINIEQKMILLKGLRSNQIRTKLAMCDYDFLIQSQNNQLLIQSFKK